METADSCGNEGETARSQSRNDPCSSGLQGHSSTSSSPSSSSSVSRPRLSFSINQILGRDPETAEEPINRDGHDREESLPRRDDFTHSSNHLATDAPHSSSSPSPSSDHLLRHPSLSITCSRDATSFPVHHPPSEMLVPPSPPTHPQSRFLYRPLGVLMGRGGGGGGGGQDTFRALHHHHHHHSQQVSAASAAAAAAMFPWMFERKDRITGNYNYPLTNCIPSYKPRLSN